MLREVKANSPIQELQSKPVRQLSLLSSGGLPTQWQSFFSAGAKLCCSVTEAHMYVVTTCQELLPGGATAGSRTRNLLIARPTPKPLHHHCKTHCYVKDITKCVYYWSKAAYIPTSPLHAWFHVSCTYTCNRFVSVQGPKTTSGC